MDHTGPITVYNGYAIVFVFTFKGEEYSVWTNEAGILVTREPDVETWSFKVWDELEQMFPEFAHVIRDITVSKIQSTIAAINEQQLQDSFMAACRKHDEHMYV